MNIVNTTYHTPTSNNSHLSQRVRSSETPTTTISVGDLNPTLQERMSWPCSSIYRHSTLSTVIDCTPRWQQTTTYSLRDGSTTYAETTILLDAVGHRSSLVDKRQRQRQGLRLICHTTAHNGLAMGDGGGFMVSDLSNATIPPALIVLIL